MTFADFTGSRPWAVLGWTMMHMLWVGALIGLVALAGRIVLRRANPALRYGFALGCFALLLLTPLVLWAWQWGQGREAAAFFVEEGAALATLQSWGLDSWRPGRQLLPSTEGWSALAGLCAQLLPWVWLCGAPLALAFMTRSALRLRRLQHQLASCGAPDALIAHCGQLADRLGLRRDVRVAVAEGLGAPALLGIVRPVLVLPLSAITGLSRQQLEMVLLHELVHAARRDNLVILIQRMAEALLFFHPAVWWLSSWLTAERELVCDAQVVDRTGHPELYIRTLLVFAEPSSTQASALSSSMAQGGLLRRAVRLLDKEQESMNPLGPSGGLTAVMAIVSTCLLGAAQAVPVQPAPNDQDEVAVLIAPTAELAVQPTEDEAGSPVGLVSRFRLARVPTALTTQTRANLRTSLPRKLLARVAPRPTVATLPTVLACDPPAAALRRFVAPAPAPSASCDADEHCAGCAQVPRRTAPPAALRAWLTQPPQPAAAPRAPSASSCCCQCGSSAPKAEASTDPAITFWRQGGPAVAPTPSPFGAWRAAPGSAPAANGVWTTRRPPWPTAEASEASRGVWITRGDSSERRIVVGSSSADTSESTKARCWSVGPGDAPVLVWPNADGEVGMQTGLFSIEPIEPIAPIEPTEIEPSSPIEIEPIAPIAPIAPRAGLFPGASDAPAEQPARRRWPVRVPAPTKRKVV